MNETTRPEGRGRRAESGGRHAAKPRLARTLALLSTITLAAAGAMIALAGPASAEKPPQPQGNGSQSNPYNQSAGIQICHATNSDTNPYVLETPDFDSIVKKSGHSSHTGNVWQSGMKAEHDKWGDIIPPFYYTKNGSGTTYYAGLNWDTGQSILENNCNIPNLPPSNAKLQLLKSASPSTYTAVGDTISYSFQVTNSGSVALKEIKIQETRFSGEPDLDIDCPDDELAAGTSVTCTATYAITQADIDEGEVTNAAIATGETSDGDEVVSNESQADVQYQEPVNPPTPSLSLVKSASPTTYSATGQTITYTFNVTNGPVAITGLVINESNFSGAGTMSNPECGATSLAAGVSTTCTATYVTMADDVTAGSVTNTAKASGFAGGNEVVSNESTAKVTYTPPTNNTTPPGGDNNPTPSLTAVTPDFTAQCLLVNGAEQVTVTTADNPGLRYGVTGNGTSAVTITASPSDSSHELNVPANWNRGSGNNSNSASIVVRAGDNVICVGDVSAVVPKPVTKPKPQVKPQTPSIEVKGVSQSVAPAPSANAHTGQGQSPWVYLLFGLGALLMLGAVRARRSGRA